VTTPPIRVRSRRLVGGLDQHWLRSTGFTLVLVGLVAAAIGADWTATLSSLVTCAVGFGFFYLLFPGGAHFGMTVANFLAIYACMFEFFRDANGFPGIGAIITRDDFQLLAEHAPFGIDLLDRHFPALLVRVEKSRLRLVAVELADLDGLLGRGRRQTRGENESKCGGEHVTLGQHNEAPA